ncbi:MAG: caspase family protein [Pseudomonadota bacterium]
MTFKKIFGVALLCFMISASYAENRALLVGIDDYWYINPLSGSKQDVEYMAQFIQSEWGYKPAQIRKLIDSQATRAGILRAFDGWLIKGSKPGDKVFFHYSGHGSYIKDDSRHDESDGYDEALCPVDAIESSGSKKNLIRDDEINQRLKKLRGRQVMMIVDACHSGTISKSVFGPNPAVKVPFFRGQVLRLRSKGGFEREVLVDTQSQVVVYSAVASNQMALVDTRIRPYAGVFTRSFIRGIRDKKADRNQDGKVTHRELLAYTRRESKVYCDATPRLCVSGLTPQLDIKSGMSDDDIRIWAAIVEPMPPPKLVMPVVDDLHVEILPRRLKQGSAMRFRITSDQKGGYLLLFDVRDAVLTRLFPNRLSKFVYLKAGKPRVVPDQLSGFEIIAKSPGQRLLVAVLVNEYRELSMLENSFSEAFEQVSKQAQALSQEQLSQQLNQALKNVAENVSWSLTTVSYEVSP